MGERFPGEGYTPIDDGLPMGPPPQGGSGTCPKPPGPEADAPDALREALRDAELVYLRRGRVVPWTWKRVADGMLKVIQDALLLHAMPASKGRTPAPESGIPLDVPAPCDQPGYQDLPDLPSEPYEPPEPAEEQDDGEEVGR